MAGRARWRPTVLAQPEAARVGLLTVKTGPLASGGIDMERGLAMFFKERNNMLSGRKIDLIVADTAGVPATARTKTQELVEKNNVHCIIGPLAAFEALAIDDYIRQAQIPTLVCRRRRGHDAAQGKSPGLCAQLRLHPNPPIRWANIAPRNSNISG